MKTIMENLSHKKILQEYCINVCRQVIDKNTVDEYIKAFELGGIDDDDADEIQFTTSA